MWEGYETSVTPEILPSSARKWISVMGPNDLKISARYLNALLGTCTGTRRPKCRPTWLDAELARGVFDMMKI